MLRKLICLILSIFFLLPFAYSQPDFQSQTPLEATEGLFIAFPSEMAYQKEDSVRINAFLFNHSGVLLNGSVADCNINVFDEKTDIIRRGKMGYTPDSFNYTIDSAITRRIGRHAFIVYCNSSNTGGFRTGNFEVNESGTPERKDEFWIMVIALVIGIGLFVAGIKLEDFSMTSIAGFIFMALGVYIYLHGFLGVTNFVQDMVSGIFMVVGGYITLRPIIEYLQNNLNTGGK